ncbi:hypothetical protein GGR52DRAFT_248751 [Hypoxylon sp. FL1284]|nr:hypothetical protein GGR52DRAFT_248751 [Hypoxylon sp. FL1284]
MAQKGGTYHCSANASLLWASRWNRDKKDEQTSALEKHEHDARASSETCVQDDGINDGQPWEIVPHPDEKREEEPHSRRYSSHFDMTFGWGKWKFTILSWDVDVTRVQKKSQRDGEKDTNQGTSACCAVKDRKRLSDQ